MNQKWIRLFQLNKRCWLEENLNQFLKEYPDSEIKVWNDQNYWYDQVIYSYPEGPSYFKPEISEASSGL